MDQPIHLANMPGSKRAGATTAASSTTSSTRRRTACTRSAAWAPSASCRTSTTCCSWPRRCRAIRWKAIASGARRRRAGHAVREEADRARHSHHDRRHELRRAVGQREGGAGPRRDRDGHVDHHRRRRHDAGGAASRRRRWSTSACRRATASIPTTCASADAIEIVIGQGAKPGGGGMLLGQKVNPRVARDAHAARGHRPALGVAGIRTGPGRTTW